MSEFEKRAAIAGEKYVNPKAYGPPYEDVIFVEGAKWARAEMQAEIDALKSVNDAIEEQAQKNERYLDFEIERLKAELADMRLIEDTRWRPMVEKLKAELEWARGDYEALEKVYRMNRYAIEDLKLLAQSNSKKAARYQTLLTDLLNNHNCGHDADLLIREALNDEVSK